MLDSIISGQLMPLFEYFYHNQALLLVLFFFLNITFAACFLPCSFFAILAGLIWGEGGVLISVASSLIANASTFIISRSALQSHVRGYLINKYKSAQHYFALIKSHDWKVIAAVQLNPILPAASFGYFIGLSDIKLTRYMLFSLLFSFPLNIVLNLLGMSFSHLLENSSGLILTLACLTALVLLRFFGPKLADKVLKKNGNL